MVMRISTQRMIVKLTIKLKSGMPEVAVATTLMESTRREAEASAAMTRLATTTTMAPKTPAVAATRAASRAEAADAQRRALATCETMTMSSKFSMIGTNPSCRLSPADEQLTRMQRTTPHSGWNQSQIQRPRTKKLMIASCRARPAAANDDDYSCIDCDDTADDDCSAGQSPALRSRWKCDAKTRTTMPQSN